MKNKEWIFKGWTIEKDIQGDFWIAPPNGRKTLTKCPTLKAAKALVSSKAANAKEFEDKLAKHGIKTFSDIDKVRKGSESRFNALARVIGSEIEAHLIINALSVSACNKVL